MQNNHDCLVSVYMLSYNHEAYVKRAIESVLAQETDFPVQIIVHDDASTDKTAEIIRELDRAHPGRLTCILQETNQLSQHISIFWNYIIPRIRGKYMILCECDDYWCDNRKLQKQVEFLESHPEYVCCTHNCLTVDENDNQIDIHSLQLIKAREHTYGRKQFELLAYFPGPTAAKLYRSNIWTKYDHHFYSEYIDIMTQGDVRQNFFLSLEGPIYYMSDIMSVYRRASQGGSWTAVHKNRNLNDRRFISSIQMRRFAKKHYGIRYHNYYLTFNAAIRAFLCYFKDRSDENKAVLSRIICQKKNIVFFLLYLLGISFVAVPLYFIRTGMRNAIRLPET